MVEEKPNKGKDFKEIERKLDKIHATLLFSMICIIILLLLILFELLSSPIY